MRQPHVPRRSFEQTCAQPGFQRLEQAARLHPGLRFIESDIASPEARERLAAQVRDTLPRLTVLVNNAGIQRRVPLASETADWPARQTEIDTLLSGPVHLTQMLIDHLLTQDTPPLIVNVTSGGAYVAQPFPPLYSACKAAMHSYTMALRHALRMTACRVVEVIPPAVNTQLSGTALGHGADIDIFCDTVFAGLCDSRDEIDFGATAGDEIRTVRQGARALFDKLSERFAVPLFGAQTEALAAFRQTQALTSPQRVSSRADSPQSSSD
ncbi:SDR family NAD(P)-dependent oxidoreductase [Pandoraea sp. NPDC087047]|uniref:SDR family NAD(P)-dependent oxidoreductase n=1 Tax=Pandoraea sp. NPDC087047 TaxID=3364390 RepID=UPI003818CF90